ncbi:MAG: hypothetical protein WCO60_16855 [Verrucomicrobiota bacterium]
MITEFITKHGFQKIGSYCLDQNKSVHRRAEVLVTKRKPLVYAIFSGDTCKYIGKTVQGYSRPLGYHKNDVMKDVRDGIERELHLGNEVTVYAKEEGLWLSYEGLTINVIEGIEQALVTTYRPEWNNFVADRGTLVGLRA